MPSASLESLLGKEFEARHVKAALEHFRAMIDAFRKTAWEQSISKGGKFIEAVLKMVYLHVGQPLPPARRFKAGVVIDYLEKLPHASLSDSIRVTLPRACRFIYDVASNRGARHDPDEIDPNEMDAAVVTGSSAWVLAELLRYSQKGSLDPSRCGELVSSLVEKKYPGIEEIEGRVYFHLDDVSARDVAILRLWHAYPGRASRNEIVETVTRHGLSKPNAEVAITRLKGLVDVDGSGKFRLLQPGLKKAENLLSRFKADALT